MNTLLIILLVIVAAMVLYALVRGVIVMAQGSDMSGQQSQNWVRKRVQYQAVAVVLVILLLLLASGRG